MRHAGRIVAGVLAAVEEELKPGVTTAALDAVAESYIRKAGARPSFKGYRGFPACICVSIDSEVVHGIPGKRVIEEGQVVSIDAGATLTKFPCIRLIMRNGFSDPLPSVPKQSQ